MRLAKGTFELLRQGSSVLLDLTGHTSRVFEALMVILKHFVRAAATPMSLARAQRGLGLCKRFSLSGAVLESRAESASLPQGPSSQLRAASRNGTSRTDQSARYIAWGVCLDCVMLCR